MKNRNVLSLLLVTSTALYAMENNPSDYKAVHENLRTMYKNYVTKQLKGYKESGKIDMNELLEAGKTITRSKDVTQQLLHRDIQDENNNSFIHIATEKKDIATVAWLLVQGDKNFTYMNAGQQYPLDICIKQLLPLSADASGEFLATDSSADSCHIIKSRQIFDVMVSHITRLSESEGFKKTCLKKIIELQLKHKRCRSNFAMDNELLQSLVSQEPLAQQPSILSSIYKEAVDDTDGSTLSYILVEQENPDELYELAQADQISWIKNKKDGRNSFDLAKEKFFKAIKEIGLAIEDKELIERTGCCLYILMHCLRNEDIKNGAANVPYLGNCCDKHVLKLK